MVTTLTHLSSSQTDKEALEVFVEHLIKEKNSPFVNEKNKKEIKDALLGDLNDAITQKFVSILPDEEIQKLNELLEKSAPDEEIAAFFDKKVPNQKDILTEVLIDFRKGYLSVQYPVKEDLNMSQPQAIAKPLTVPVAPPMPVFKKMN